MLLPLNPLGCRATSGFSLQVYPHGQKLLVCFGGVFLFLAVAVHVDSINETQEGFNAEKTVVTFICVWLLYIPSLNLFPAQYFCHKL